MENAISEEQLEAVRNEFVRWVEESQVWDADYGQTLDGRPRFDLRQDHNADTPALRRIQSLKEVSEIFKNFIERCHCWSLCKLIGPPIRFHHGKINSKFPDTATEIKWHQSFPFEPMTKDDTITFLFVDNITLENGPLEVLHGPHRGQSIPTGKMVPALGQSIMKSLTRSATKLLHVQEKPGRYA